MDLGATRGRRRRSDRAFGPGRVARRARSDEELLEEFVAGDREAFSELMQRHEQRVFAVALRLTGNRADALDSTQETFLAVLRRASSYQGNSAFGTWLYRIAVNASRDVLRKRRRYETAEKDVRSADPSTSHHEEAVPVRIDVARALALLPPEFRDAVTLHDICDLSYEEIAGITEVEVGTVKSRVSRGRRKLAKLLERRDGGRASKGERYPLTPEVFPP